MEKKLFNILLKSTKQAHDISSGKSKPSRVFIYKDKEIAGIRERLNLSQDQFANLLRIPSGTFRNWEQGRTIPDAPAQTLLMIADKHPEVFQDISVEPDSIYRSRSLNSRFQSSRARGKSIDRSKGIMERSKPLVGYKKAAKKKKY